MTHAPTTHRWTMGIARLVLVGAAALFFLSGGGPSREDGADALTDQAGAVTFTIDRTPDGAGAAVSARTADGVLIYDLQAHLCIHGSGVRTFHDFGFSGKKCTNAPVGGSDVEQRAKFPEGTAAADLPIFRLGQGTTRWFNADNYDQEITCAPGAPCDLVVLAQITGGEAIYSAELCFDAVCPAGTVGGPDPNAPAPPPAAEPPPAEVPAAAPVDAAAAPAAAGGTKATGGSKATGSSKKDAAGGTSIEAAGKSASSSSVNPETEPRASTISVATPTGGPSQATRVRAAAVAGLAGGVLIAGLIGRGRRTMTEVD